MKQLSCKDMGANDDFVAMGETAEEVKNRMMDHMETDHNDMMEGMSESERSNMMQDWDRMMKDV